MLSGLLRAGIAALHGWAQTWVSGSRRAWKLPRRASFWLFLAGSERAGGRAHVTNQINPRMSWQSGGPSGFCSSTSAY